MTTQYKERAESRSANHPVATEDNANNFSYYHEYCRLYLANIVLTSQMKELIAERYELVGKLDKVQKKVQQIQEGCGGDFNRNRRFRRTANQIQRHYRCPVQSCQKSYGSEGSLNQHIKIKHRELYSTMPHLDLSSRPEGSYSYQQQEQEDEQEQQSQLQKLSSSNNT